MTSGTAGHTVKLYATRRGLRLRCSCCDMPYEWTIAEVEAILRVSREASKMTDSDGPNQRAKELPNEPPRT